MTQGLRKPRRSAIQYVLLAISLVFFLMWAFSLFRNVGLAYCCESPAFNDSLFGIGFGQGVIGIGGHPREEVAWQRPPYRWRMDCYPIVPEIQHFRSQFLTFELHWNEVFPAHHCNVIVPLWFLTLLPLLPLLYGSLRTRRAIRAQRCVICGYDLRATPDRCPECGFVAENRHEIASDA